MMATIMIARARMPVVSPETETRVGTGVGVSFVPLPFWWRAMAADAGEAARAEPKACKTPARKVIATRKILKIISKRGMWAGFMFLPSITETRLGVPAQADRFYGKSPSRRDATG
jgi:hypothetical protein